MRAWTKVVVEGLLCGLTLAPVGVSRASDAGGPRIDLNTAERDRAGQACRIGPWKAQAIVDFPCQGAVHACGRLRK